MLRLSLLILVVSVSAAFTEELPAAVTAQIAAHVPGAKVTRTEQRNRDGVTTFRVGVEAGGKKGKLELAADGKLLSLSLDIEQAVVPTPVERAAKLLYPGAQFEEARRHRREGAAGPVTYELQLRKDKLRMECHFDDDGKLLERRDEMDAKALPEAVLDQVNATRPGGHVTQAYRRNKEGREYFDLEVSSNYTLTLPKTIGTRTELRTVDAAELPENIRAAAKDLAGDVSNLRFTEKTTPATTVYEVTVRERSNIEVSLDGKLLKAEGGQNQVNQGGAPGRNRPTPPATVKPPSTPVKPPAPPDNF